MPSQKISKNLPKRCMNAKAKERRSACWVRGQQRKTKRRAEDNRRHQINLDLVAAGGASPGGRTAWPRKRLHGADKAAFKARVGMSQ